MLVGSSSVSAQGAPGTDVHLFSVSVRDSTVVLGAPVNITARPGYDNQPAFTPDGRAVLFTSVRGDGQSDIYRYDLQTRATTRVTATSESEYSATPMPDGRRMSVIRVEADSTQRLWSFELDGSDPRVVLADIKPVGYHAWANDSLLALFVLGSPATLQVANGRSGTARTLVGGIGRSIHRIPGSESISFVHKQSDSVWVIRKLDPRTDSMVALVRTLPRVEDYAWSPDGRIFMAQGSKLFAWKAFPGSTGAPTEWREVASWTDPALARLSRIAVSPRGDWIAIVAAEPSR
jgi:dipeptidyl aminopeptidase/acylaminoacyl peptidase